MEEFSAELRGGEGTEEQDSSAMEIAGGDSGRCATSPLRVEVSYKRSARTPRNPTRLVGSGSDIAPATSPMTRLVIKKSAILAAKEELDRLSRCIGEELESSSALTLARKVTSEKLSAWEKHHEGGFMGLKVELLPNGDLIAIELTSTTHAMAVWEVQMALSDNHHVAAAPSCNVYNPQGLWKDSDVLVNVFGQFAGGPLLNVTPTMFTTVVVEIGVSQSTPNLCNKLGFYTANIPSLQAYVAIKRYEAGGMIALVFTRANNWHPSQIVSFGTAALHHTVIEYLRSQTLPMPPGQLQVPTWESLCVGIGYGGQPCNALGILLYQLSFPVAVVFTGRVGGIPVGLAAGVGGAYVLDLFRIQQHWI